MTEPKRRKRSAISCTLCRRRKIRCNRETPCSNCVRSRNVACIYETEAAPTKRPAVALKARPTSSHEPAIADPKIQNSFSALTPASSISGTSIELESMRSRVLELEEELLRSKSSTPLIPPAEITKTIPTDNIHVTTSLSGAIDILQERRALGKPYAISRGIAHKNRVFGQSHWMNGLIMFKDIMELLENPLRSGQSSLLSDVHKSKKLARKIKTQRTPTWPQIPTRNLPSKDICDILVDRYIQTSESVYRILHIPSFRRDYEMVWGSEVQPSIAFIMQLKLVLAIGAVTYDQSCSLRAKAGEWLLEAQTWISSPTFKSQLGIQYIQNSVLLLIARQLIDIGSELVWISTGALIRTAMYIGLHKDPTQLPRLTFLEREMRRRLWNTVLELNLQFSLISGGPSSISAEDFNTQPPGNFDDEQLFDDMPTPRPNHIFTQSSLAIVLRRTFTVRLAIVSFLNDLVSSGTYEETLRLDTELRSTYKALRNNLQAYATSGPSAFAIASIDFIMHRYIVSLHTPFFHASLHEAMYAFSRKSVVDSSFKIWALANDASSTASESDFVRFCRCGAGFFRGFTFQSASFLAVELRAQLEDEDTVPRPDLVDICNQAAKWYMSAIEAGETGIKGLLLLNIVGAQIDCIKRRTPKNEVPMILVKAAERGMKDCLPVLERLAGTEDSIDFGDVESNTDFDFEISPDFLQNWDIMMADVFNVDNGSDFDGFLY